MFHGCPSRLTIRVERSSSLKGLQASHSAPEFKFEEDTLSLRVSVVGVTCVGECAVSLKLNQLPIYLCLI